jgi:hypothetical protein
MSKEHVDLSSEAIKTRFDLDQTYPEKLLALVEAVDRREILPETLTILAELYARGSLHGTQLALTHDVLLYLLRNDGSLHSAFFQWMTDNKRMTWQKYQRNYALFLEPLVQLRDELQEKNQPRLF